MELTQTARETVWRAERSLEAPFRRVDAIETAVQQRVLEAFWAERVSARHFAPTNGYGYDDDGRDTLDRVFARAMQCESALVRPQFVNGTHAIFIAIAGLVEPGDEILFLTGSPYDTLRTAFGLEGDAPNSLKRLGVSFRICELTESGMPDEERIRRNVTPRTRIAYAQRSRGYAWRNAFLPEELERAFLAARSVKSDVICFTDNCYGEFTCVDEPSVHGADVLAGSLIKNPGGGLAPTGGYAAGRNDLIARIAQRLTVPGMGGEVGSYASGYRLYYQGLFLAPHVTVQCVKGAILFARVFELLGMPTSPESGAVRSDIIQAAQFTTAEQMIAFCGAIQHAAPVDSYVTPEPWEMPGYADKVVMAAGAFVQGATTELSADGPIRPPYTVYLQGALTYPHARISAMMAVDALRQTKNGSSANTEKPSNNG